MGRPTGNDGEPQATFRSTEDRASTPAEPVYELGLISTDAPPAPSAGLSRPRIWRRLRSTRVSVGSLVLAVAAAAALGATGAHRWQAEQHRRAEESTVSLVVVPSNATPTMGGRGTDWVRFEARLVVVNSGPLPIEIDTLQARQAGLTLQSIEAMSVKAGDSRLVPIMITMDCPARLTPKPIEIEVFVRTVDDRRHRHLSRVPLGGINQYAHHFCSSG